MITQCHDAAPMMITMITMMTRMVFSTSTGFLVSKRPAEVDGWVFLTGLSILLIQFNEQVRWVNYKKYGNLQWTCRSLTIWTECWNKLKIHSH